MNDTWNKRGRMQLWPVSRYCIAVRLNELRKIAKHFKIFGAGPKFESGISSKQRAS
jgi:hypothetical protein